MAFQQYLQSSLPDIPATVAEFRRPVHEAARKSTNTEALEEELWTAWRSFTEVIAITPHGSQKPFVQFVKELRNATPLKKEDGSLYEIWNSPFEWDKLPLLGVEIREQWNDCKISL
jgi:hypothetical protein